MTSPSREVLRARLREEVGTLRSGAENRIALVYPSPYHVGMSSLGYQAIYGAIHDAGYAADRAFLPDDVDDPVPVIRLLNRQRAGHPLDPEEVYEVLDGLESVVIGDVARCRAKMQRYAELGVDRLMCLMQFGALPHASAMQSLRLTGEALIPALTRDGA